MHEKRAKESPLSSWNLEREHPEAPPNHCITKIIWMSRISPESSLAELALIFVFVCNVIGKLLVRDCFHQESNNEETCPNPISPLHAI